MWNDSQNGIDLAAEVDDQEPFLDMQWVEPDWSKKRVNWAGRQILEQISAHNITQFLEARRIVDNWRASHSFPLNTFQNGLRGRARNISDDFIVAQRIKRYPSIFWKLKRFPTMTLSQMQDIGGCRAIVPKCSDVVEMCDMYEKSRIKHELQRRDDYINSPKESGYRGVHLIYRYNSDRKATYNSLIIEMQLRSFRQHSWATAVETVGLFVGQALKSNVGEKDWLDFFRLMGTGVALLEETAPVPNTPSDPYDLAQALHHYVNALDVFDRLSVYSQALNIIEERSDKAYHYYLIELDSVERKTIVKPFGFGQSDVANQAYTEAEEKYKDIAGSDVVLVSVDSLEKLRKAYPNYFADTRMFLETVDDVMALGGTTLPTFSHATYS